MMSKETEQSLRSDIDFLILSIRELREENAQLRLSQNIIAQRLADERNEPLSKWT